MKHRITKLKNKLNKVEKELEKVRGCNPLDDGWQTMRLAKKQRKWDILAQEKMEIKKQIEELKQQEYNEGMLNAYYCVACGAINEEDCCCDNI